MKIFNYLFYVILFGGFFLPTNSNFYIPAFGVLFKINEISFILLPILNYLSFSENIKQFKNIRLKRNIFIFFVLILFTEVLVKRFLYGQSFVDAFMNIRLGLPMFSAFILIYQGIKPKIEIIWKVLLLAISTSIILSFISIVYPLPIYYDLEAGSNLLAASKGRLVNSNSSFGIIGLYLLFEKDFKWYNHGKLVRFTSILSVIALVLSFNRTYLAIMLVEVVYLVCRDFRVKQIVRGMFIGLFFLGMVILAYVNNDMIQRQVDHRILTVISGDTSLAESTIENNREFIYDGVINRLSENAWIVGLPRDVPIFVWPAMYGNEERIMNATDTSFLNVLLIFGILPFVFWIKIIKQCFWRLEKQFIGVIFIFFLLSSLNVDSLVRHNSIFFLTIIFFLSLSGIVTLNKKH